MLAKDRFSNSYAIYLTGCQVPDAIHVDEQLLLLVNHHVDHINLTLSENSLSLPMQCDKVIISISCDSYSR